MKSESCLIIELGAVLLILAGLSFFFTPAYEKAVWFIIQAVSAALSTVIGYKFGRSMPEQSGDAKPGQSSTSQVTTKSEVPPVPAPAPAPEVVA